MKKLLAFAISFFLASNALASGTEVEKGSFNAVSDCWIFSDGSALELSVSKSQCTVKISTSDVPSLKTDEKGKSEGYVFIRTDQSRFELHALGEVRFEVGTLIAYSHRADGAISSGKGQQKMIGVSGSLEGGVASCQYEITDSKPDGTWLKLDHACDWIRFN